LGAGSEGKTEWCWGMRKIAVADERRRWWDWGHLEDTAAAMVAGITC